MRSFPSLLYNFHSVSLFLELRLVLFPSDYHLMIRERNTQQMQYLIGIIQNYPANPISYRFIILKDTGNPFIHNYSFQIKGVFL